MTLLFLGSSCFAAGPIIIGVRGGAPLNDTLDAVSDGRISTATDNYVVGPTLGVRLPLGFSVEADALFSRLKLEVDEPTPGAARFEARANSWEFPLMLKFTPGSGAVAPVFGAGMSVRHLRDFGDIGPFLNDGTGPVIDHNSVGFVAGVGLRLQAGPVAITPEVRYTRWGVDNIREGFRDILKTNKNQGQFLVGITF